MGDFDNSLSLSSLLCHENESCFFNDNISDHSSIKHDHSCFGVETEVDFEYVEKLVERETITFGYRCRSSFDDCLISSHNWLKFARLDAIEWILNVIRSLIFRFLFLRFFVLFPFLKSCVVLCSVFRQEQSTVFDFILLIFLSLTSTVLFRKYLLT